MAIGASAFAEATTDRGAWAASEGMIRLRRGYGGQGDEGGGMRAGKTAVVRRQETEVRRQRTKDSSTTSGGRFD